VKREGGLEKAGVHRHAVGYEKPNRAGGRVETILPEFGVFGKRQNRSGHYSDSLLPPTTLSLSEV
jgi:hypothetical protein